MKLRFIIVFSFFLVLWVAKSVAHKGEKHDTKVEVAPNSIEKIRETYIENVEPIFQKKCFDCHSNKTNFPWYYKLPLVKGMIDSEINEAKEHLDMSEGYPFDGHGSPVEDLEEIKEVVVKGDDLRPDFSTT